jgi:hypothetical protein
MKTFTGRGGGQLVTPGDCSVASRWTKIPAVFGELFGIFRGISEFLCICCTICRGTLVGRRYDTQIVV